MKGGFGRGSAMPSGGGFYKNKFALDDYGDDDDDLNDYGDQYYEEDSDDANNAQYMQNYPPGALFSQPKMGASAMPPGYGGMSSASGVPFYGQQAKMGAGLGYGATNFGGGSQFGASAPGGGGGFTYGMASKGGNVFGAPSAQPGASTMFSGAPSFGASSSQQQQPGLFQFGSVSQFGGLGGAGAFSAGAGGSLFGGGPSAAAADDPYANIALDLNKVKKAEPPPKLYEHKSEEEKKKEKEESKANAASANTKSNLKKDDELGNGRKRSVTFGKSTTYEVERGETDESGDFNRQNVNEGKGSPRPQDKKVIEEKDLSDGRSEKEKILAMLEQQQRQQLEEIKEMNELKSKYEDKKSTNIEESIGESSSSNIGHKKQSDKVENSSSYESDDFEDISASGSGSKQKLNYWPGKDAYKKEESAHSVSQSHDKESENEYNPNAMEEYLKKQKQMQAKTQQPINKKVAQNVEHSESSDKYDDDFESISKSQNQLTNSMLMSPNKQLQNAKQQPFEYKPPNEFKSQIEKYVKKDNKFIQTDEGKYSYMGPSDQTTSSYKEWTLQQNLKDAEGVIQDLKSQEAEQKQKIFDLESQLKKKEMDYQSMRREALNAQESFKRQTEQVKNLVHQNNLYKIETEELIKQIDLADAKTREKEDDLKLMQAEYERKMKQQEERILMRRSKNDDRITYELKREHEIEKDELQKKMDDMREEIDYYQSKVTKLESENASLRVGKDQYKRIKELEDQIESMKRDKDLFSYEQENYNTKNLKTSNTVSNTDSKQEQSLKKEVQHLEMIIKGFQEENEKAVLKQKQLEKDLKETRLKLLNEQHKFKEESTKQQQRTQLEKKEVYVEQDKQELDIKTVNTMGPNAISLQQLQEMHTQIRTLQAEKFEFEKTMMQKEQTLKTEFREERAIFEKQINDIEFLVGEKDKELTKIKDEYIMTKKQLSDKIVELEDKVVFFRQNQKLLTEDDEQRKADIRELQNLREKTQRLEEECKRVANLEKKCKLLEETIKSKNPNNIPMMLQAVKEINTQDKSEVNQMRERIKHLEIQLDDKDKDFEKKLRALRQEQERVREMYEKKKGQTPEAKRITELEDELQNTKNYYNKRIREIEDKYKFRIPEKGDGKKNLKDEKKGLSKPPKQEQQVETIKNYEETIERITKERNLLAQKVVNLETANNKRRQSFSGILQIVQDGDPSKITTSAIYNITQLIKINADSKEMLQGLMEAALICLEQLKQRDPSKNKQLSQYFLSLTQELNTTSKLNERQLTEIMEFCKNDLNLQGNQSQDMKHLKRMNSAAAAEQSHNSMNKDIQGVINFYPEEQKVNLKSPAIINKPPKPAFMNPFTVTEKDIEISISPQKRNIKDILKQIVQSGIDFERIVIERRLNPKRVSISTLYQIVKEDNGLKSLTLDELKQLNKFVKEKCGYASESITQQEEIDINELMNVVMDVSLDMFKDDPSLDISNLRYSQELKDYKISKPQKDFKSKNEYKESGENLLLQEKIDRMQKVINDLNFEKRDLQDKLDKLESGKNRMERILKQSVGMKFKKTGNNDNTDNNEFIDELTVIMKRIEYLEQQSDERDKLSQLEHGPCRREIQRLQQELESERNDKLRMLAKKNSEVAYFKSELDILLNEMKNTMTNKQRKQPQINNY